MVFFRNALDFLYLSVENCVSVTKEKKYYNDMLENSVKALMLFPYHLSDVIVKKLDLSPFEVREYFGFV